MSQDEKDKVDRTMVLMQSESRMPAHYIKPLEEGIYELRILYIYDGARLVVLLNCFTKKAIKLKKQYYEEKQTW